MDTITRRSLVTRNKKLGYPLPAKRFLMEEEVSHQDVTSLNTFELTLLFSIILFGED